MRVVVLGAGIIGVSAADALARGGADVTVLDRRGPGRGASAASAGILAPYTEAHSDSPLLPFAVRSLSLFDNFVASIAERTGQRIEYQRSGTVDVAFDDDTARHRQITRDWLDAIGVGAEWIDAASLHGVEPAVADAALGALLVHTHGFVDVRGLVRATSLAARFAGAIFETTVDAFEVVSQKHAVLVRAGDHTYEADVVVVAAGSWSGRLKINGSRSWPVRPVRGQLLELRWRDDVPLPRRVVWGPHCYVVPWADRTVLVGATAEEAGFDERSTVAGVAELTTAVAALIPDAHSASVEAVRVGLRPATSDNLPIVGPLRSDPRIIAATGHFRNGILLAPLTAEVVGRFVLSGAVDDAFAVMSPDRF